MHDPAECERAQKMEFQSENGRQGKYFLFLYHSGLLFFLFPLRYLCDFAAG